MSLPVQRRMWEVTWQLAWWLIRFHLLITRKDVVTKTCLSFYFLPTKSFLENPLIREVVSILTWRHYPSDEASRFCQLMLYLPSSLLIVNCFLKGGWLKMDFFTKEVMSTNKKPIGTEENHQAKMPYHGTFVPVPVRLLIIPM